MKKILSLSLATIMTLASLTGCGNSTAQSSASAASSESAVVSSEASSEAPKALDKLVMTYVTSPLNVPSIVGKEKEIIADSYKNIGTELEYVEITSGAEQTQALASGDVQILNAVGATSVILSAANGGDIKVLSMYSRSPKAFALYSKDESIKTPQDLKGKTIAGPMGTNLHQLLIAYLATADMTIDDVNYVNMNIPNAKAGMDGGSVDVAMLAGPIGYAASQDGAFVVSNGEGLIDAIIAVAVSSQFYNEHKTEVDAFLASQQKVADYMENNSDETISVVAKALDITEDAVKAMYVQYDFATTISEADIAGFQRTADFMVESGMLETAFDTSDLFIK